MRLTCGAALHRNKSYLNLMTRQHPVSLPTYSHDDNPYGLNCALTRLILTRCSRQRGSRTRLWLDQYICSIPFNAGGASMRLACRRTVLLPGKVYRWWLCWGLPLIPFLRLLCRFWSKLRPTFHPSPTSISTSIKSAFPESSTNNPT